MFSPETFKDNVNASPNPTSKTSPQNRQTWKRLFLSSTLRGQNGRNISSLRWDPCCFAHRGLPPTLLRSGHRLRRCWPSCATWCVGCFFGSKQHIHGVYHTQTRPMGLPYIEICRSVDAFSTTPTDRHLWHPWGVWDILVDMFLESWKPLTTHLWGLVAPTTSVVHSLSEDTEYVICQQHLYS